MARIDAAGAIARDLLPGEDRRVVDGVVRRGVVTELTIQMTPSTTSTPTRARMRRRTTTRPRARGSPMIIPLLRIRVAIADGLATPGTMRALPVP